MNHGRWNLLINSSYSRLRGATGLAQNQMNKSTSGQWPIMNTFCLFQTSPMSNFCNYLKWVRLDTPPDFLISPCARGTRRSPFSTRRKLRRGWPTAKRRRQPLPRWRECSPCVKYRAHGEHIRRVLFVAHGEIKVTNGVGRSLRQRGQLRRVLAVWHTVKIRNFAVRRGPWAHGEGERFAVSLDFDTRRSPGWGPVGSMLRRVPCPAAHGKG